MDKSFCSFSNPPHRKCGNRNTKKDMIVFHVYYTCFNYAMPFLFIYGR